MVQSPLLFTLHVAQSSNLFSTVCKVSPFLGSSDFSSESDDQMRNCLIGVVDCYLLFFELLIWGFFRGRILVLACFACLKYIWPSLLLLLTSNLPIFSVNLLLPCLEMVNFVGGPSIALASDCWWEAYLCWSSFGDYLSVPCFNSGSVLRKLCW